MHDSPDAQTNNTAAATSSTESGWGWYLYGIIRDDSQAGEALRAGASVATENDEQPLEAIPSGGLVAIVRRVPLADYSVETLQARAEDLAWIEAVVRRHNAVIEAIHQTQAVLPAQFGAVYPRAEDVRFALDAARETLLERLSWLRDCDEWGVRLYGDSAALQQAAAEQSSVQRLRDELSSASPGRAYFLQRKLADELANATERLVDELVGQAYDQFARHAKAGQVNRQLAGERIVAEENRVELVRATFLVPRESAKAFIEDIGAYTDSHSNLWCEYSGPWPPYSFVEQLQQGEEES